MTTHAAQTRRIRWCLRRLEAEFFKPAAEIEMELVPPRGCYVEFLVKILM